MAPVVQPPAAINASHQMMWRSLSWYIIYLVLIGMLYGRWVPVSGLFDALILIFEKHHLPVLSMRNDT